MNTKIETRKDESRFVTSDQKRMLNMFTAKRVLKTYTEDFVDEDTTEAVSIERNEVLFEKGVLIDQDIAAQIAFAIQAGDIKEVEVSNQRRMSYPAENEVSRPYIAQVEIGDRKHKFLLYACTVDNAIEVLKDYVELNYQGIFTIIMIKEFEAYVILIDNLKEYKVDAGTKYLKDEITLEEYVDEKSEEIEENKNKEQKRFFQLDVKISYDKDCETVKKIVVLTYNVDRAMMLIDSYLKNKENEYERDAKEHNWEYEKKEIAVVIESAKPIPVGCLIPREFSAAYV